MKSLLSFFLPLFILCLSHTAQAQDESVIYQKTSRSNLAASQLNEQLVSITKGQPNSLPSYAQVTYSSALSGVSKNHTISMLTTVYDHASRSNMPVNVGLITKIYYDPSLPNDINKTLAEGVVAGADFIERQKQADRVQQSFQNYYTQSEQNARAVVAEIRQHAAEMRQAAQHAAQQGITDISMAVAQSSEYLLTQSERNALEGAIELKKDDLRYNEYDLNDTAQADTEQNLESALQSHNVTQALDAAEQLAYGKVNGAPIQSPTLDRHFNSEGVLQLKKMGRASGPFESRKFSTSRFSQEGQVVRRLANRYQRLYDQTSGLTSLDANSKARYTMGQAAVAMGDEAIANGDLARGGGLMKMASLMADSVEGFVDGFADSVVDLARSVPELAHLAKQGAMALYNDPVKAWSAVVGFAADYKKIGGAIMLGISNEVRDFAQGDARERSRMIDYYALDVVSLVLTGGAAESLNAVSKAQRFEAAVNGLNDATRIASRVSRAEAAAAGAEILDKVNDVERLPPSVREGLQFSSARSPEVAAEILNEWSDMKKQGKLSTAEYMEKVAASKTDVDSVERVQKIARFHSEGEAVMQTTTATTFDGTVSRGIPRVLSDGRAATEADVFTNHSGQLVNEHRYTIGGEKGISGQYSTVGDISDAKPVIEAELGSRDIIYAEKNIHADRILDLTDRATVRRFNIEIDDIKQPDYDYTQALGSLAKRHGFDGIKFIPFGGKGVNLVIFN